MRGSHSALQNPPGRGSATPVPILVDANHRNKLHPGFYRPKRSITAGRRARNLCYDDSSGKTQRLSARKAVPPTRGTSSFKAHPDALERSNRVFIPLPGGIVPLLRDPSRPRVRRQPRSGAPARDAGFLRSAARRLRCLILSARTQDFTFLSPLRCPGGSFKPSGGRCWSRTRQMDWNRNRFAMKLRPRSGWTLPSDANRGDA